MNVHLPEAANLSPEAIRPAHSLVDSTGLLGDLAALDRRYEEDGYLYFRGVLDQASIATARRRMAAPLIERGLAAEEGEALRWTGGDQPSLPEDAPEFSGVVQTLVEDPANQATFEQILGEPACTVPMIQYRAYKPNGPLGGVHQDGFYSPGILGYRPLWIPLVAIDADMGGLVLAPRHHKAGFFHNTAKPPRCSIPEGVIGSDVWARADYRPGDLAVIHPYTPHVGLPNRSDFVRLSIDTRIQSAANPATISGTLAKVEPDAVTVKCGDGKLRRVKYDADTFLRIGANLAERMTPEAFRDAARPGMPLIASLENERALMIRRAHAG
jgi:hypothetical protein